MAIDFIFQGPPPANLACPGTTIAPAVGLDSVNGVGYLSSGKGWVPQIPATVAKVDLTGQNAAIAATTLYAVPAHMGGQYRISVDLKVTTAATTSSTLGAATVNYTDADDSVAVSGLTAAASNSGNTTTTQTSGSVIVNAKGGTNIQYAIAYASVGATAMVYSAHIRVDYMG